MKKYPTGSKVAFISDLHICHEKPFILNPRGFESALAGYEAIVRDWNGKISNEYDVYVLGDTVVGAGKGGLDKINEFLLSVNYRNLYLMPGNHFSGYKQLLQNSYSLEGFVRGVEMDAFIEKKENIGNVFLLPNYHEILVGNKLIVLSHYPMYSWNEAANGSWMIHGHTHGNIQGHVKGKILDIGVEVIGNAPVTFEEIKSKLDPIDIFAPDHHLNHE